jgi:hypothetical protein
MVVLYIYVQFMAVLSLLRIQQGFKKKMVVVRCGNFFAAMAHSAVVYTAQWPIAQDYI